MIAVTAYYNEYEPYAAQWLKNLIAAGHIAGGEVDTRSISDVRADDLKGFTQCHFFAGIGGWSLALRMAGWSDDRPVWTGSCPCQPFSVAGQGKGTADERHLWPVWFELIKECRPSDIFGEQVEAAIRHGWLDLVQTDLESIDYTSGAVCIPAGSVGAPHIRQRLWFVAHASSSGLEEQFGQWNELTGFAETGLVDELADTKSARWGIRNTNDKWEADGEINALSDDNETGILANTECGERRQISVLGHSEVVQPNSAEPASQFAGNGWSSAEWIPCRDNKWRPVEPGTFPLAHGVSNRVGRLRAYGNAICPQAAKEFIKAYMSCIP